MKQWRLHSANSTQIKNLSSVLGVSNLVSQLLINRGLDNPDLALPFLNLGLKDLPSPFLMKDMDRAVDRVLLAMEKKEKVVIYGDYDVDGTTATSLLTLFFEEIGFPVSFTIPDRMKEGYSLNEGALVRLKESGTQLLVTVDNGISAFKEAAAAARLGLDLIITDHHQVPAKMPQALAVLNPHRPDDTFPAKEICGTGVAFYLMMGIRQKLREQGYFKSRPEPHLRKYLDLVALATVADVVPLTGINRVFVREGLEVMKRSQWVGLEALKKVAGIEGEVDASHLGFRLGPRVNACGRLALAATGVMLLTSKNREEAEKLAQELDNANRERQEIEREIVKEALAQLETDPQAQDRMAHVLYSPKWHPGVIGIVASRIVEKTHRPTLMLGSDGVFLKGSARSVGGLNLVEALGECKSLLVKYGGHQAAAGVTMEAVHLKEFQDLFEKVVRSRLSVEQCQPMLAIDAELSVADISERMMDEISKLKPFGQSNPEPVFCLRAVRTQAAKIVGKNHLKFSVTHPEPLNAIAFGYGEHLNKISNSIDLAFNLETNEFRGRKSLVLHIKDIQYR